MISMNKSVAHVLQLYFGHGAVENYIRYNLPDKRKDGRQGKMSSHLHYVFLLFGKEEHFVDEALLRFKHWLNDFCTFHLQGQSRR